MIIYLVLKSFLYNPNLIVYRKGILAWIVLRENVIFGSQSWEVNIK